MSSTSFFTSASTTYSRIGLLATGIMTFGSETVRGLSLIPSPAARMTAFMRTTPAEKLQGCGHLRVSRWVQRRLLLALFVYLAVQRPVPGLDLHLGRLLVQ